MKVYKILLVITLILGVAYFPLDRQLFYYGKNDFNFYHLLPLGIKPVFRYDFEGGFALEDKHGFGLISRGDCQYVHSDIKLTIKDIIKYGYTEDKLVAFVEDTINKKYFIECSKNNSIDIKQDLIVNIFEEKDIENLDRYEWVQIKDNEAQVRKIELPRNLIMIIFIILFLVLIYKAIILIKRR